MRPNIQYIPFISDMKIACHYVFIKRILLIFVCPFDPIYVFKLVRRVFGILGMQPKAAIANMFCLLVSKYILALCQGLSLSD
jgi:hypothetical protein